MERDKSVGPLSKKLGGGVPVAFFLQERGDDEPLAYGVDSVVGSPLLPVQQLQTRSVEKLFSMTILLNQRIGSPGKHSLVTASPTL